MPVAFEAPNRWKLPSTYMQRVSISYDVDLTFVVHARVGAQRGGQMFGNALYIVNKALFVLSDAPGPRIVQFEVPSSFKIATPLTMIGTRIYRATNNSELADNTTVLGSFPDFSITEGSFHLAMAMPGDTVPAASLLRPVVAAALHEYIRVFTKTPVFNVTMTYFRGLEENGEAYRDSAAFTTPNTIRRDNEPLWADYVAHELFHHWNASLIAQRRDGAYAGTTDWFMEGATEYMANRTLVRYGFVDSRMYLRMMESNVALYSFWTWSPPFAGTALDAAGSTTALPVPDGTSAKTYNRPAVYSGGWLATFCLDGMIAKDTNNHLGMDDFFRLLFERFGLTRKPYSNADLAAAASQLAGRDLEPFFARYIAKPNPLPISECLKNAGLDGTFVDYSGFAVVNANPRATKQEKQFFLNLIGR